MWHAEPGWRSLEDTPAVPGTDIAGVVEAVGVGVTRFAEGAEALGETLAGTQWRNGGAYAEYVVARAAGAEVTGVEHPRKLDLLRTLGASKVVDHTKDDIIQVEERYDLVFDVAGVRPYAAFRPILAAGGRYVLIGHAHFGTQGRRLLGSLPKMVGQMACSFVDPRLPRPAAAPDGRESRARLQELLADGRLAPVVDRTSRLEQAVEAIECLATGAVLGRVVVVP